MIIIVSLILPLVVSVVGASITSYFFRAYFKASAWAEGYYQGVQDEIDSENANMPGYGPARLNPYRDWRTGLPLTAADQWRALKERWAARKIRRKALKRMTKHTGNVCEVCRNTNVTRKGDWDYCPQGHQYIGRRAEKPKPPRSDQ